MDDCAPSCFFVFPHFHRGPFLSVTGQVSYNGTKCDENIRRQARNERKKIKSDKNNGENNQSENQCVYTWNTGLCFPNEQIQHFDVSAVRVATTRLHSLFQLSTARRNCCGQWVHSTHSLYTHKHNITITGHGSVRILTAHTHTHTDEVQSIMDQL